MRKLLVDTCTQFNRNWQTDAWVMRTGSGKCGRRRGDSAMSLSADEASAPTNCDLCLFSQHACFYNLSSQRKGKEDWPWMILKVGNQEFTVLEKGYSV